MNFDRNRLLSLFWTFTILFYLLRTIFEPFKYLFLLSSLILIICFAIYLVQNFKKIELTTYLSLTKEFHILSLFLVLGIFLSKEFEILSLKSFINFVGISFFFLVYFSIRNFIQLKNLLNAWISIAFLLGILGLFKWIILIVGANIAWLSKFYIYGTSLVSDYNFYACYFIITIVAFYYALHKELLRTKLIFNQLILSVFILNVLLSGSRRGFTVLIFLLLISLYLQLKNRKNKHGNLYRNLQTLIILISSFILIFLALIPFRTRIIQEKNTRSNIAVTTYRYSTIFFKNITYDLLYEKLWPGTDAYRHDKTEWENYATYNNVINGQIINPYENLKSEYWKPYYNVENLLYNGDFENGTKFWRKIADDSIKHEIINTSFGKAIRVTRELGNGWWPLEYEGREIYYYAGVTYRFKFKYRVLRGSEMPFMIGWWIDEGDGYINNLTKNIRPLENNWFECTVQYTFKNNQQNMRMFLNSLSSYSEVDFADIELTCDDTLNRPNYVDQIRSVEGVNIFYNSNFVSGLEYWDSEAPDSISHELIDTKYGKALRVSRNSGHGYWPLVYKGREIFYYKNLTYNFRFKYRVIKGDNAPFNIGWWLEEEDQKMHILRKDIFPLDEEWYECIASYKFEKDHYGSISTFMNSQSANTVIDFADIELICSGNLNLAMYSDEKADYIDSLEKLKFIQRTTNNSMHLFSDRTQRWKYAWELWTQEYSWYSRIFGKGFDYLKMYGQKFYPNDERIDYPHNPIISSFLYSGILGGFFYIYFLVLSFWYYWKNRKHHLLLFLAYLICFTFVFISSDSHFNVPIFAMLSLVPFITKHLVKEKELLVPI